MIEAAEKDRRQIIVETFFDGRLELDSPLVDTVLSGYEFGLYRDRRMCCPTCGYQTTKIESKVGNLNRYQILGGKQCPWDGTNLENL